jgi:hypothetical protein
MMERAIVLVAGPTGSGKTTLIEHLLRRGPGMLAVARCIRDDALRVPRATTPRGHRELGRYREAGACGAIEYRFPGRHMDLDDFFTTRLMQDFSDGVLLEGDDPIEHPDLSIFVAPALAGRGMLFRRVTRDRRREKRVGLERLESLLGEAGGVEECLVSLVGRDLADALRADPRRIEELRLSLLAGVEKERAVPPPAPTRHWAIARGYEGIERAQVVVVNIRGADERRGAERLARDLGRLRKDEAVFRDVLGWRGSRTAITAVVANLADPRDRGLKKALARIGRSW